MISAQFSDTTWDDTGLASADMMVLGITREEVESQNISKALSRLMMLSDQRAWVEKFNSGLLFFVSGYDDEPSELFEIPEVRHFMRELTLQWPFWFHFINRDSDQIMLLLNLLCEVEVLSAGNCLVGYRFRNIQEPQQFTLKLFGDMNRLHASYDLPCAQTNRITAEIENCIMGAFA